MITVGQLKKILANFKDNQPLVLSFIDERGYSDGSQCTKNISVDVIEDDHAEYLREECGRDIPDGLVVLYGSMLTDEDVVWERG